MWAPDFGEEHANSIQALVTAVGVQKADKQDGWVAAPNLELQLDR